jgi:hypothetical protein
MACAVHQLMLQQRNDARVAWQASKDSSRADQDIRFIFFDRADVGLVQHLADCQVCKPKPA